MNESLPFSRRIALALAAFFRVLGDGEFAHDVDRLRRGKVDTTGALFLLRLLQQGGRFVDFLQDDVSAHPDAKIGAVARVVHGGCRKALADCLQVEPVLKDAEGSAVTIEKGFDSGRISLTGNVVGEAPFQGTLTHHGWRVTEFRLPDLSRSQDVAILARAEVEV